VSPVKTFYIRGEFKKGNKTIPFGKYVRAMTEKDAIEHVYNLLGSKDRVKRNLISIDSKDIKIIENPEEIKDTVRKTFATEDDLVMPKRK
jgi:large subunit ribosomal protein LX